MTEIKEQQSSELMLRLSNIYHDTTNTIRHGTKDMFFWVGIETSTNCNRKCPHCPNYKHSRGMHEMSLETFAKIIDDLKEIGYNQWIIPSFYNEPFLDKRLPKMLKYAKGKIKCKVMIFSNGDYITQESLEKVDKYVDKYIITDHGNFNKDMPKNKKMTIENLKYMTTRGGLVKIPKDKERVYLKKCDMATQMLQILWNGDVVLCCEDYFGNYVLGNINKDSIKNIWDSQYYKIVRKSLRKGFSLFPICNYCFGDRNV